MRLSRGVASPAADNLGMERMVGVVGTLIGSWIGWKIGAPLGMIAAFVISTIGSGVGLYFAKRMARNTWG